MPPAIRTLSKPNKPKRPFLDLILKISPDNVTNEIPKRTM
jgi:hypothetical protein